MIVLVTRHGETNYNELGLCNADPSVDVHLTDKGKVQARSLKKSLKNYKIDKIYISNLPRTRETAEFCCSTKSIPVVEDKRISDIQTGFESRPVKEFLAFIKPDIFNTKPPGGESFVEEKGRVHTFIDDLKEADEECVLIVTHMDPAKIIVGYFNNHSDEEIWGLKIKNCELFEFTLNTDNQVAEGL